MAGWLERLRERMGRRETASHKRVRDAIEARSKAGGFARWLDQVRAACEGADTSALALVAAEIPTEPPDPEIVRDGLALLEFWRALVGQGDTAWLRVRLAEAEQAAGDSTAALDLYLAACEGSTELALDEGERIGPLAEAAGGEALFRWQVVELRAYLEHIPDDEDWVRERYSELLDLYRDQPERLARLYEIGARIREMEAAGLLPQSMVVRPPRKPQ